jgi:outer membrane biosynthesis protein TonB
MKQGTNNEMDLLLRQLARRQDVFAPGAEDHLDADELSAYAENALPAKTRARYTEHLAECSRCRDLVVQLSASAGVVIAERAEKVAAPSGWRKFLASLLSPMVLRYAAPALGLIVVAVIGLVVLRRDQRSDFVSQVQNEQAKPIGAAEQNDSRAGAKLFNDSAPTTTGSAQREVPAKNSPQQPATPAPQGTPAAVAKNVDAEKASEPKPEAQPVVAAAEPPAPVTKTDVVSEDKRQQNKEVAQKKEAEVKVTAADESKNSFEMGRARLYEESATARARAAKSKSETTALAGAATGAAAPASGQREEAGRDDKDSKAETRSVAGRRFRKQGGVWIDTAYESPRATMDLSRGSEAYRTLIADEPAIKTIADQLDGEIIVVWKGRVYHIR